MGSFIKLTNSDVSVTPYKANKKWSLDYEGYPNDDEYIVIYNGTNLVGTFSTTEPETEGEFDRLVYASVNQLFYQKRSDYGVSTGSLGSSLYYEDPTGMYSTGSYFNYNDNPTFINNFPTGSNEGIRVIKIRQDIYGSQLKPTTVELTSTAYDIVDDGLGNLFDTLPEDPVHVGNVFYSHGLLVITNQEYQMMFPLPPIAKDDYFEFLTTDDPKEFNPSLNDTNRNGTGSSIVLLPGPDNSIFLPGDPLFTLDSDIPRDYSVDYRINNGGILSNIATINVSVRVPYTESTTSTSTTTTTTTAAPVFYLWVWNSTSNATLIFKGYINGEVSISTTLGPGSGTSLSSTQLINMGIESITVTNTQADTLKYIRKENDIIVENTEYVDYIIDAFEVEITLPKLVNTNNYIEVNGFQTTTTTTTSSTTTTTTIPVFEPKWIGEEDTAYCETEDIVINDFDHMVVRFLWNYPADGKDLDTFVGFINTGTIYDNDFVGYGQGPGTVPDTASGPDAYLWWAADDTNPTNPDNGVEAVVIGMRKFIEDNPGTGDEIQVRLNAVWWAQITSGNISLEVATYKGGVMQLSGTDIINVGGTQVSSDVRSFHVAAPTSNSANIANSRNVAILKYNKLTQSAVLELQ